MNYKKHYSLLIDKAKNRYILPTEYKERHHIIPKCIGGSDNEENIVSLLAKEHLLAHLLLTKMYPENHNLIYAIIRMSKQCGLTGRSYENARIKFSNCMRTHINPMSKYNPNSFGRRCELSRRQTENNIATRQDVREKMSKVKKEYFKNNPGPFKGKKASLETRKKQAEKAKNRIGKNASRKKKYNLISPEGKIYYCEGTLMQVIRELCLSSTPLKTYKGCVVPHEHRSQYNTILRNNTTGWKLIELS